MRWAVVIVALALLAGVGLTAANGVPTTYLGDRQAAVTANDLKPAECAGLNLDAIRTANGNGNQGRNALVLGTPAGDTLVGGSGDDCLVGGDGDDVLRGNSGFDVCVGGPGADTFHVSCEIRVQ